MNCMITKDIVFKYTHLIELALQMLNDREHQTQNLTTYSPISSSCH